MSRVVATANIFKGMDLDAARAAVDTVLTHGPHILALEEWGRQRDGILRDLSKRGYSFARPGRGGGPVVLARGFGLERCYGVRLSRAEVVGHLVGRKNRLPESIATVVLCHDESTGDDLAVVEFHLTAEVQFGGRYRRDPAHLLRVLRHRRERRRLRRLVRKLEHKRTVYALGDTNYDGMSLPPLRSCWDGGKQGTLGGRAVDVVFARQRPVKVRTVVTGSDHRAVVATYR